MTDHLGSTEALTDSSGAITSSTSYDSFGNATSNIATTYRYTGREYDSETGLYYYRNRWYDPEIGRFTSKDPIGFAGGDINLYGYVGNNPPSFIDPFGNYPCSNQRDKDDVKLSGFAPSEADRIRKALEYALNEKCATAFKAAGLKTVSEQISSGITFVHGDRVLRDYQDKLWAPDRELPAKMRKVAKAFRGRVADITYPGEYQGRRYSTLTRVAFQEKIDHFSVVLVHALVHSGGQKGINRWWDEWGIGARHDLERMGKAYDRIISACSKKESRLGKSRY